MTVYHTSTATSEFDDPEYLAEPDMAAQDEPSDADAGTDTPPVPLTGAQRSRMILEYYPLVKSIAYRMVARYPSSIDVEDLINVGSIGLIDAVDRYTPSRQESFKTYVETRIRGAIIDELRQLDWVPRSVRQRVQELEKHQRRLEADLGRAPTETEVAQSMNMDIGEYQNLVKSTALMSQVSLEDLGTQDESKRDILQVLRGNTEDPDALFEAKNANDKLAQAIRLLPIKERRVLQCYYYEDMTLREIGQKMSVTESRVSQIHSAAIKKLRIKLKKVSLN